jgi:diguanylate cyclase (GGDEF)-like protein
MLPRRLPIGLLLLGAVPPVTALALDGAIGVTAGNWTRRDLVLVALLFVVLVAALALLRARRHAPETDEAPVDVSAELADSQVQEPMLAPPAKSRSEPESWEALLQFARELTASPEIDRVHATISRNLPKLLGSADAWVVTRFGSRQRIILSEGSERRAAAMLDGPRDWRTFPVTLDGTTIGVMGVATGPTRMSEAQERQATEVATLLAHSLRSSDAFERMREENTIDGLTGCLTRSEGADRLEIELRRTQRTGRPLAVLLLDLDHFKSVNDRYGHPCGDVVLGQVGRIMMHSLRASDVRCRWGGEEFLIALPETSLEPAKTVAEVLRRRIAEARIDYRGVSVQTTASIGVTVARPGETDRRNLLVRADAALYRAKNEGRNRVRAVVGDLRGNPVAVFPQAVNAPPAVPFPDRRDGTRLDRRKVPGPGRRRTDSWIASDHRA